MRQKIEEAIRTTLVILNKQSINRCVNKIIKIKNSYHTNNKWCVTCHNKECVNDFHCQECNEESNWIPNIEYILNHCLNDAFCNSKTKIKKLPTNSNEIADFVNKWLDNNK